MAGLLLPRDVAGEVAEDVFHELIESRDPPPRTWEAALHWLTSRVSPAATQHIAAERESQNDPNYGRDPARSYWPRNPHFGKLRQRSADGALTSREWNVVDPILWARAGSVFAKFGIGEDDGRDIYMETFAEMAAAKLEPGPLEAMKVFEELPRFFNVMLERRAISWMRKRGAKKRQADNPALSQRLDDPDSPLMNLLADPASALDRDPWASVSFEQIHASCRSHLSDFEWHLINALFVEGSHTRLDLATDAWVLEQMGMRGKDSESKRRRGINAVLETSLAKLGRALGEVDLVAAET
jgi:hypothetical protein